MNSNIIYVAFGGRKRRGGGEADVEPGAGIKKNRERVVPGSSRDVGSGFHLQGEHRSLVDLYTRRQVAQLIGISEGRLKWWEKCGLIKPSRRYGREKFYSFENIIAVRAAKELTEKGCRATRIKNAVKKLCEQIPEAEKPLTKMKVFGNDRRLVIEKEGQDVEIDSGQVLIDFSVSSVVRKLQDAASSRGGAEGTYEGRSGYEWFLEGVRLEEAEEPRSAVEAEEAYRKAIELEPDLAPAVTNLGNIKFRSGEIRQAEDFYRKAIREDPYLPQPYYNLGCLKLDAGRPDLATVYLRKASELDPEFPDVYFQLALALEQEGRKGEALDLFKKFLEMEGDSSWSSIARSRLEEGS